jgi:tetratricopeptide (TPR) repeat protein
MRNAARCINNHPLLILVDLGNVYAELGRLDDALQHYARAIEEFEKTLGTSHHPLLAIFTNMAVVLYERGDCSTSIHYYNRAQTAYEQHQGRYNCLWIVDTIRNVGYILNEGSDNENPKEYYNKALSYTPKIEDIESAVEDY